jgi:F-type H+-transporting ATPase subunit gamma
MPSLKEIKGRISSVRSTLKITSAMKMVASAKLHKVQFAIRNMLSYEHRLHGMLVNLMTESPKGSSNSEDLTRSREIRRVAIVALASNSSLCGSFNNSVIREATAVAREYLSSGLPADSVTVYSIGRKMADAMRKLGFPPPEDYSKLSESPNYEEASNLAHEFLDGFRSERFDRVELVYNHYESMALQPTVRQVLLPLQLDEQAFVPITSKRLEVRKEKMPHAADPKDYILEPSREEIIKVLLPKIIQLRVFTTLLDSAAAEHAARTVAMQMATDNARDLLEELTLEYNKSRQQKITNEILDLVSGSLA